MPNLGNLLWALDERQIAEAVGLLHDEARMSFPLQRNTVSSFDEFSRIIGGYVSHHYAYCVARGGTMSPAEAVSWAKEILEDEYRRRGGDIVSAYNDAHEGTNGGLRVTLNTIADRIKADSVERYIRDVLDQHVAPNSWEDKVALMREFLARCGVSLSTSVRADQPERYAQNYRELVRAYVRALQQTSTVFRRF
jgi:hypothetical protein